MSGFGISAGGRSTVLLECFIKRVHSFSVVALLRLTHTSRPHLRSPLITPLASTWMRRTPHNSCHSVDVAVGEWGGVHVQWLY